MIQKKEKGIKCAKGVRESIIGPVPFKLKTGQSIGFKW